MNNLKEKFCGGAKSTYQEEQAKQRTLDRERADKKLRRRKSIKDRKARQKKIFEATISRLPAKVKEVHLDGLKVTKDALVRNILSDVLKVR